MMIAEKRITLDCGRAVLVRLRRHGRILRLFYTPYGAGDDATWDREGIAHAMAAFESIVDEASLCRVIYGNANALQQWRDSKDSA